MAKNNQEKIKLKKNNSNVHRHWQSTSVVKIS
jgi:protein associated with RNAse G/E